MPVKIGFQVVASTEYEKTVSETTRRRLELKENREDEKFRATELNYHGPTARGWRSSVNCTFPQEIILQLKVLAILQQIQILAHQYLIPQKIEICTSSRLDHDILSNSIDFFEYLGFITFSDNKATGFRSRELKSILIPSKKAKYIKLRIHNNHVNVKNFYNQVGLMAVNVLGNELHNKNEETEMNNNISFHAAGSYAATITYNSNYLSPFDDLAFQMSVDEETARIIKIIEYKMLQAVYEERLDYANALKITLENLRAAGEILGIYEQEKKRAINLEDFDRAKSKKIQIDHFRRKIYSTLRIDKLLDQSDSIEECDFNSNPEEKAAWSNEGTPSINSPRRNFNGRTTTPNEIIKANVQSFDCETNSPSRLLHILKSPQTLPNQLIHSQSQTFSDPPALSRTPAVSTSASNPHLKQMYSTISESCHELELDHVRTPSSISDSLTEGDSSPPKSPKPIHMLIPPKHKETTVKENCLNFGRNCKEQKSPPGEEWGGRGVKIKTSLSEQKIRGKTVTTNAVKSSFEAYEDRMLPALRSYHGHEVVRECQLAFEQRKSTLNEREKKQAMLPIAVFGIEMIEKFYSKSFCDKEDGLKQLQQGLKRAVSANEETDEGKLPSYNKVARAAIFLLHRGLRDTVYSVYKLAAETVRLFFAEFVPQRVSPSEIARSVEKLLPELLTKSGDVTPRIHNLAAHTLLSMAECEEVRRLNIIPTQLSRPLTSSVHPRLALSRLEMVEQLILNHGISKDKKSGLTCRTLAEFGSSGLHHPAEAVRKVSERILIQVYKVNPRIVRKQLPPDDNVTRRNLLYRQLFQEFDFMDVQRRLSEQALEDSMTAYEANPQFLSSQHSDIQNKQKINLHLNDYSIVNEEFKNKSIHKPDLEPEPKKPFHLHNTKERTFGDKTPLGELLLNQSEIQLKSEVSSSKKQEKPVKSLGSDSTKLKLPSLNDSIKPTKVRILPDPKKNQTPNTNQTENSLTASLTRNNRRRDGHVSGIPVPTFGTLRKLPANINKKMEKPQIQQSKSPKGNEGLVKSKMTKKSIRIRMFDSMEEAKPETIENAQKSIKSCLEKNKDNREMEVVENIKFSDSMLASIRENEFTMSGLFNSREDAEEKIKRCIFCLTSRKWTNDDSLNRHYLKNCLMLTTCEYCMEVTEISGFTNHLLDDCKWKNIFQKCINCREAILRDLYDKHECTAIDGKVHNTRCPFCHKTIGDGETAWRKHLMGNNTCPNHPRQK